jgi:5S rRNA maturation endonuclease (ribonuclease M5)
LLPLVLIVCDFDTNDKRLDSGIVRYYIFVINCKIASMYRHQCKVKAAQVGKEVGGLGPRGTY